MVVGPVGRRGVTLLDLYHPRMGSIRVARAVNYLERWFQTAENVKSTLHSKVPLERWFQTAENVKSTLDSKVPKYVTDP